MTQVPHMPSPRLRRATAARSNQRDGAPHRIPEPELWLLDAYFFQRSTISDEQIAHVEAYLELRPAVKASYLAITARRSATERLLATVD